MTRQVAAPIQYLSLTPTYRPADGLYYQHKSGSILLDPPYQRASVWTADQRLDLMYSFLSGYPIGVLILNDRTRASSQEFRTAYAVIDGRQRIETILAWFDDQLALPASWLPESWISQASDTPDGPYVTRSQLTEGGDRNVESTMVVPVVTAQVATVAAEAQIYRLVNTGGTAHTDGEIARAATIENS